MQSGGNECTVVGLYCSNISFSTFRLQRRYGGDEAKSRVAVFMVDIRVSGMVNQIKCIPQVSQTFAFLTIRTGW